MKRIAPVFQSDVRGIGSGDSRSLGSSRADWPTGGLSEAERPENTLADDLLNLRRVFRRLFGTSSWTVPPDSYDFCGTCTFPTASSASLIDPDSTISSFEVGSIACVLPTGSAESGRAGLADSRPEKAEWGFVVGAIEVVEEDRLVVRAYGESRLTEVLSLFYGGEEAAEPTAVAVEPGAIYYLGRNGCLERIEDLEWAEGALSVEFGRSLVGAGTHRGTLFVAGSAGELGDVGPAGEAGPTGNTGPVGRSGREGVSGTTGVLGKSGTSGSSGFSAFSGASGSSGEGYSGASGASGASGSRGRPGTAGTAGTVGVGPGTSGASGFSGSSGSSGYSPSGASGKSGASGTTGNPAPSGYSGASGFADPGFSGFSGYSPSGHSGWGPSGASGTSGTTGVRGFESTAQGLSGFSGKTTPGYGGKSGFSGRSGYKGVPGITFALYPNLIRNPSFDETRASSGEVEPWILGSGLSYTTSQTRTGARAVVGTFTVGEFPGTLPYENHVLEYADLVPIVPGAAYKLSWRVKLISNEMSLELEQAMYPKVVVTKYDVHGNESGEYTFGADLSDGSDLSLDRLEGAGWVVLEASFALDGHYVSFSAYPFVGWNMINTAYIQTVWAGKSFSLIADDFMLARGSAATFVSSDGFEGPSGLSGKSGFSGVSGVSGSSGTSGASGQSGRTGFSGRDGDGESGFSGRSGGSGVVGPTGFSGFSGLSGQSGQAQTVSGRSGASGPSGLHS